jgi:hypothetical protein
MLDLYLLRTRSAEPKVKVVTMNCEVGFPARLFQGSMAQRFQSTLLWKGNAPLLFQRHSGGNFINYTENSELSFRVFCFPCQFCQPPSLL